MTIWKNFRCGRESRGNELLGCGAKTPNVRLRGQGGRGRACPCPPKACPCPPKACPCPPKACPCPPKACPCPQLLSLLLLLAVLLPSAHAQTPPISPIDRAAAYQNALPLYQYDATRPLAVKLGATQTIGTARLLRFSYLSTNNQRVPALLFTPHNAAASHSVPCLVILHGLGGSKEMMAGLALFAAKAGMRRW